VRESDRGKQHDAVLKESTVKNQQVVLVNVKNKKANQRNEPKWQNHRKRCNFDFGEYINEVFDRMDKAKIDRQRIKNSPIESVGNACM